MMDLKSPKSGLRKLEAQLTKNSIFGLNLLSNCMLKSLISINLLFTKHKRTRKLIITIRKA